jgi:hypothetical protein
MFDVWIYFVLAVTVRLGDEWWQNVLLLLWAPQSILSLTTCSIERGGNFPLLQATA